MLGALLPAAGRASATCWHVVPWASSGVGVNEPLPRFQGPSQWPVVDLKRRRLTNYCFDMGRSFWKVFGGVGAGSNFLSQPQELLLSQGRLDTLRTIVFEDSFFLSSKPN